MCLGVYELLHRAQRPGSAAPIEIVKPTFLSGVVILNNMYFAALLYNGYDTGDFGGLCLREV